MNKKGGKIINNKIKKNNKIINLIQNGIFSNKDFISPSYINILNPKYIEIDNIYYSTLLIINYNREYDDLILKNLIDSNLNINISMIYEKQNPYKVIKDLTYHIGNVGVDLQTYNDSRQDIDIAAYTYNDAKYIRKEIQINNEDLYYLYIFVNVFATTRKDLEYIQNKIEGLLQSKGMQTRRAYFRQEQAFKSCLPFFMEINDVKNVTRRNILTSGLLATYPFLTSSIFDEDGVLIGSNIINNSLIFINKYSNKYKNSNMCVFGTSGAGKSFFNKLLILRYRLLGYEQYVIDPEREYNNLCDNLEGTLLKIGPNSNTYINILDIREESLEESQNGYLATKIIKLIGFFNLIFGEINEEEKSLLEQKIINTYNKKNINFDDKSLYKNDENNKIISKKIFKNTYDMPILEDLYNELINDNNTKKMGIKLIPFIKGSMNYFNNYTNIEINNKLIVADVYELGEENLKYGMYLFTELFWDKIKKNRNVKKSIYLDEIWRLIGITSNKEVASFIYKIFKTIRKYGGSAIAITQDIYDLFSLENGIYGRSILNNSSVKCFFSLEEENLNILQKYENISDREKIEIKSLKRGEALMIIGDNHIIAKIDCAKFEENIINGGKIDKNNYGDR
ncbi:MAG: ATP-binding protein [Clostridia bacterium]|nr:ATP-binding protein [Clostridia bacterium]